MQIEKSKIALREMLMRCEEAEGRPIPSNKYDVNGELDQEHIFCAICDVAESSDVRPFSSSIRSDIFKGGWLLEYARRVGPTAEAGYFHVGQ